MLGVTDASGVVSGWDLKEGALLGAAQAHDGAASACRWAPKSHALVSCGYDGYIAVLKASAYLSSYSSLSIPFSGTLCPGKQAMAHQMSTHGRYLM